MLDFQKYNIKEKKQKDKRKKKKKPQELLKNNNNHKKTIHGVCVKNRVFFFEK